jgi:hypothetical protein
MLVRALPVRTSDPERLDYLQIFQMGGSKPCASCTAQAGGTPLRGVFFRCLQRVHQGVPWCCAFFQMNLFISRHWLKVAWRWMKRSETEGVVTAQALAALLGFMAEMVSPGTHGRKKNTLRFGMRCRVFVFVAIPPFLAPYSCCCVVDHRGSRWIILSDAMHDARPQWYSC